MPSQQKGDLHPLVALAKSTVEAYILHGAVERPPAMCEEMLEQAGVFVSIKKKGALRGCIGTFEPVEANVAEEIMANAISSATRDPRFPPVAPHELDHLTYSVDLLTKPEPVDDVKDLDPQRYGIIVECGRRRGLLLPALEGVDTVADQIAICRQKAGIMPDEVINLYRFEVRRYLGE